jgi:hypothetical protein
VWAKRRIFDETEQHREEYLMGLLSWIGRTLAPIALEHGAPLVREWWKARLGQNKAVTDQLQQLADAVEQLQQHAARVDADLDALNTAFTANENRLRKWVLTLLIWNACITVLLVVLASFALRH